MTEDERIDEIIGRTAASEYNRPPAVPSDEMWAAIQAARQSATAGPKLHVTAGGASRSAPLGGYSATHRAPSRYTWFAMAAAAVLLVATGVGIGRWTSTSQQDRQVADQPSNVTPTITGDGIPTPQPSDAPPVAAPSAPSRSAPAAGDPGRPAGTSQPVSTPRTRDEIRSSPKIVGTRPLTRLATENQADRGTQAQLTAATYQVATQQHLQEAETLLTSFSLESRDERMNSQFAGWAKGLLSNTRLLLDSPAGEDPRRAKLLQDLEVVLAQIVQLSPNAAAQERELIQGSIQDGHVMTRLRTAIPAGQPREITER